MIENPSEEDVPCLLVHDVHKWKIRCSVVIITIVRALTPSAELGPRREISLCRQPDLKVPAGV
jgi:hypothetical protein